MLKTNGWSDLMGKPKAPAPPDPAALAREQAEANRVTTFTPFGNINFGS
jgi:hypothetical protein